MIPNSITSRFCASQFVGRPNGFTLIITISLLVLLTLIAVALLSLSSITIRSSTNDSAQQQARANARMALMLAIGQLQKEMGPDPRICAPQDAGTTAGGNPRWTAVYDAWKSDPAVPLAKLTPASRVPKFRTWLVSGANSTTVNSASSIPLVGAASLGASATPLHAHSQRRNRPPMA